MVRIGITGGIGSGKSTVVRRWQQRGATVCQADQLARDLMVQNWELISEIKSAFGEEAYHPDGTLNRPWLAGEAFEKGRVGELNAIVHPHIPGAVEEAIRRAEERGEEVFVYEAALLPAGVKPAFLDYLVIIVAPEEERVRRVADRDDTGTDAVEARMNQQPDFSSLLHLADLVIRNDGSLADLEKKADDVYEKLVTSSGKGY